MGHKGYWSEWHTALQNRAVYCVDASVGYVEISFIYKVYNVSQKHNARRNGALFPLLFYSL